jgi:hypothetical protein
MKTTVEALKDYYVEIGGTATDVENVTTIPDMIDAITAMGGGSSLPEVTIEDDGDVLTVINGVWDKSEIPIPSSDVVVFNAIASNNNFASTATLLDGNKCGDIDAAINAGKFVIIMATIPNTKLRIVCKQAGRTSNNLRQFDCLMRSLDGSNEYYLYVLNYGSSSEQSNLLNEGKIRIALYSDIPTT